MFGPPADSDAIPRSRQSVAPVGLVPHLPPVPEPDTDVASEPDKPAEPEVDLTVVYMPPKKKALGVNAPSAPLSCGDPEICRRVLWLGGVGAGVAVASVTVGSVLHTRPDRLDSSRPIYMHSTRVAGTVVIMAGVSVAIVSGLLLFASLRDHKRPAKSKRARLHGAALHF